MNPVKTKEFPSDYPSDALNILHTMSMGGDFRLLGSMSIRSQLYAGDYDGYEVVSKKGSLSKVLTELRKKFQDNVKKLRSYPNTFIGDIKCGVVSAWKIIPSSAMVKDKKLIGYNATACRATVDKLLKGGIITESESNSALSLLKDSPTVPEFLLAKQKLKYHVLRWTVGEVLANKKVLRDGSKATLEDGFDSPGITKLDCISLVANNRFTDFSVIYEFKCNGKVLNPEIINPIVSLEENVIAYMSEGNYFKVLKRLFAVAKIKGDTKAINELIPILNSDLGILNLIVNDIDTLILLLDDYKALPMKLIRFEIDQFIGRLSNVYTIPEYLNKDDAIIGDINRVLRLPDTKLKAGLERLRDELNNIVQLKTKPIVKRLRSE